MKQFLTRLRLKNVKRRSTEVPKNTRKKARSRASASLQEWLQTRPHLPAWVATALSLFAPVTGVERAANVVLREFIL
jgi:hypothetical protein